MKPDFYSSGDYAGLTTKNFQAYYGYEEVDENGEWCFTAKFGDENIKVPFSKLKADDQFNCVECLLIGIGWVLTKHKIV